MARELPWFPFQGYLFFAYKAVKLMDDAGVGRHLRLARVAQCYLRAFSVPLAKLTWKVSRLDYRWLRATW